MFSHIVFAGGGAAGLVYLGVIQYLEECGLRHHIKHAHGTSIGAFVALAFVLKLPMSTVADYIVDHFQRETTHFQPLRLLNILVKGGLDFGHRFTDPIDYFLTTAGLSTDITFEELAKATTMDLVVCATNMTTGKPMMFSLTNSPTVKVKDAVIASMSIPGIIQPIEIQGAWYLDGVLSSNIPVPDNVQPAHVLVVLISSFDSCFPLNPPQLSNRSNPSMMMVLNASLRALLTTMCSPIMYIKYKDNAITFGWTPLTSLPFRCKPDGSIEIQVRREDIEASMLMGFETTKKWVLARQDRLKLDN